jgi:hypothetical protein
MSYNNYSNFQDQLFEKFQGPKGESAKEMFLYKVVYDQYPASNTAIAAISRHIIQNLENSKCKQDQERAGCLKKLVVNLHDGKETDRRIVNKFIRISENKEILKPRPMNLLKKYAKGNSEETSLLMSQSQCVINEILELKEQVILYCANKFKELITARINDVHLPKIIDTLQALKDNVGLPLKSKDIGRLTQLMFIWCEQEKSPWENLECFPPTDSHSMKIRNLMRDQLMPAYNAVVGKNIPRNKM